MILPSLLQKREVKNLVWGNGFENKKFILENLPEKCESIVDCECIKGVNTAYS